MKQYEAVILRLHGRAREDEEAITDLLNERARMGWSFRRATGLQEEKLLLVFARET